MEHHRLLRVSAVPLGRPFRQARGQPVNSTGAKSYQTVFVMMRLYFSYEVFVRVCDNFYLTGGAHFRDKRIIARSSDYKIALFGTDADHVHQIEAANQGIAIDSPEQAVSMA